MLLVQCEQFLATGFAIKMDEFRICLLDFNSQLFFNCDRGIGIEKKFLILFENTEWDNRAAVNSNGVVSKAILGHAFGFIELIAFKYAVNFVKGHVEIFKGRPKKSKELNPELLF